MIIATAGHVDHGKTELIKALTGIDTDRLPEEKTRGLSIDLGFAYHTLPNGETLGFVDVPGHEKFIRNMLAGISGIDIGLLVVAADDGIMEQTREHLAILDLLNIGEIIVAITKIDRVASDRISQVQKQIYNLFSDYRYTNYSCYPVCALTATGVQTLKNALVQSYKTTKSKNKSGYFRMAIDRAFNLKGIGLIVTGMVFSGTISIADKLILSSTRSSIRVRGIRANNKERKITEAGDRCALNIVGRHISKNSIKRGDWLMQSELHVPSRRIDVHLRVLETENTCLKHWTPTKFYIGSDNISARVAVLSGGNISSGDSGLAQLVLSRDALAVHGDRFVLRDQSSRRTIAGGYVLDPHAPKRGRARPHRISMLMAMQGNNTYTILKSLVEMSMVGLQLNRFLIAHNLSASEANALISSLKLRRVGNGLEEYVFCDAKWNVLLNRIMKSISNFHKLKPTLFGPSVKDVQLTLDPFTETVILNEALKILVKNKQIGMLGNRFHLPSHDVFISEQDLSRLSKAIRVLTPDSGTPPSLNQVAQEMGVQSQVLRKTMRLGIMLGDIVKIDKNRYLSKSSITEFKTTAELLASRSKDGNFSTIEYRNQIGLGRNFIISLLDYFDQIGFTIRIGDNRQIRTCDSSIQSIESCK